MLLQRLLLAVPIVAALAGPGPGDVRAQPEAPRSAEAPVRFEQITTEDGLSQSTVFAAVQDRQGFLWFGTEDGLNRYDGRSFRVYRHHPDDATSLSNNWVWTLFVDRSGTLWVGTLGGGLNRYDPDRDGFVRYRYDPDNPGSLAGDYVRAIAEDHDGRLWIGTDGRGLCRLDSTAGGFVRYWHYAPNPNSLSGDRISTLLVDRDGVLWAGTYGAGLNRYDPARNGFTHVRAGPGGLPDDHVNALHEGRDGTLWIGSETGLTRAGPDREAWHTYRHDPEDPASLAQGSVMAIKEDRDETLWVGVHNGGGLHRFDPAVGRAVAYRHDPRDPYSLSNNAVRVILEDRVGTLWIGTHVGVNKLDRYKHQFSQYWPYRALPPGSVQPSVWSVLKDRSGTLWMGTSGRLFRYDESTGAYDVFRMEGLPAANTRALLEDRRGRLWIGYVDGHLARIDSARARVTVYSPQDDAPRSIGRRAVRALYEGRDGTVWIGTDGNGLFRYDPDADVFLPYPEREAQVGAFHRSMRTLYESQDGMLWAGTWGGGLYRIDPATGVVTGYKNAVDDTTSLSNDIVLAIEEDASGRLWVGTMGGLNRLDPASGVFRRYFERDGLPNDVIFGLLPDGAGHLWMSTGHGIARLNPETGAIRAFTHNHGLHSNEFSAGVRDRGAGGRLYFGGSGGVTGFDPARLLDNPHAPPVVVTGFSVLGRPFAGTPPERLGTVRLAYRENFFAFEFAALDFTAPAQNRYAYRLDGLDEGWVEAGTRPFANYTNVPPGTYTFRVRAANSDGVWNEEGVAVAVAVAPPFWGTWWFRALVLGAAGGLLYAAYRYRVRHLLHMERLRLRIASDLHDDIGSNLSSIALISDMVGRRERIGERERRQLADISATARTMAEALRDIVWFTNPTYDRVDNLVIKMEDTAAMLLQDIAYTFDAAGAAGEDPLDMTVRRHVFLAFKEMLHNVVRHAGATKVHIRLVLRDHQLALTVHDNGAGFDAAQPHAGSGLRNLHARVEQLGGTLALTTRPGHGTTVALTAPLRG